MFQVRGTARSQTLEPMLPARTDFIPIACQRWSFKKLCSAQSNFVRNIILCNAVASHCGQQPAQHPADSASHRTLDSSLHSTFAKPRHRTLGSSLHSSPFPRVRHRTVQHCTALCTQQPCTVPPGTMLWPAACTAPCTAPLPDLATALDSSLHSTAPCQTSSLCSTCENFCEQLPRAASSLLHSLCQTSPACSTLHSTFPRLCHRCEQQPATTCTTPWTAQHLCQTSPPHCKQQPHSRPAQHPAQHLCQTSPPQSEHQPAHHHAQDHSTAPLPDFATALTAACTAFCTAPLPDFATKSATEDLTFEK